LRFDVVADVSSALEAWGLRFLVELLIFVNLNDLIENVNLTRKVAQGYRNGNIDIITFYYAALAS
jgi:hypothetical protein